MRNKIFLLLIFLLIANQGFTQSDSLNRAYMKWEVGAEGSWDFRYAYYTDEYASPHGSVPKVWDYGMMGSFTNHSYGIYAKYRIFRFLSVDTKIKFANFRISTNGYFDINFNDTIQPLRMGLYYLQTLEFPLNLCVSFFNRSFIHPNIFVGINNSLDVYEQARVNNTHTMFYKNRQSGAYTIRGRLGAGLDFTLFKRICIGADACVTTGPWWRSDKTMVKGIKYAVFSAGIHSGYLF